MNPVQMRSGLSWQQGWRYGLMGLPLAFVALPLYVLLPNYYARNFAVPLATLGAALLAVRLFDTLIDPLLGRWADRLHGQGQTGAAAGHGATLASQHAQVLRRAGLAALALCLGFALLFLPPVAVSGEPTRLLLWLCASLLLTTVAFSALSILHQAWGARLGGDAVYRSRVVAWREGFGLAGVVIASISPVAIGIQATIALLFVASWIGWQAWRSGPMPQAGNGLQMPPTAHPGTSAQQPVATPTDPAATSPQARPQPGAILHPRPAPTHPAATSTQAVSGALWLPWQRADFRRLMAVFMLNGIASAVPATLMLFFVQDRLRAPANTEPMFLGSYFLCAALSLAFWLKLVARIGLARTWLAGMLLSVAVFAFASGLGAGDVAGFVLVCALSGLALGTDLALPAALLTGVIQTHGDQQRSEGAYFGWWAFAGKLNLALAAGLALPLLGLLGYAPGSTDAAALNTLTLAYCVLPCVLKSGAALLLYFLIIRKTP